MDEKKVWLKCRKNYNIRNHWNSLMLRLKMPKLRKKPSYKGKKYLSFKQAQEHIKEIILAGKPALVARFGWTEATSTINFIGYKIGAIPEYDKELINTLYHFSGVFPPTEEMAFRFADIQVEAAKEVDFLGAWNTVMQEYLINEKCKKDVVLTLLESLEPFFASNPWTAALKGKKVLVVHPFVESIKAQYEKRKLLFDNPDMLPDFELKTVKAVQTLCGETDSRFKDWEEALSYMYGECMKEDFDVAILGCGAYGMPLGAKLKQAGKIALHTGGVTQLLFGIKGSRWEGRPSYAKMFNEHWSKPLESETPQKAKTVEGGCYW